MNFPELKMQVLRQLKRDLAKAESYFNRSFDLPEISYALKGKKAGVAYLQTNQIRFNPVLLQENGEQFIRQVVPHELAHLLVFQLFGRVQPHGKEWKMMMETVLGVAAETVLMSRVWKSNLLTNAAVKYISYLFVGIMRY